MHIFKDTNFSNAGYMSNNDKKTLLNHKNSKSIKQYFNGPLQQLSQLQSSKLSSEQRKQNLHHPKQPISQLNDKKCKKVLPGKNIQSRIDYGIFNQYRLDQFFDLQKNLDEGTLIPIASVGSHTLHLEEKFLNFMEKYNEFQLIFVGVYGPKNSGKSLFLDKILNMATFEGPHYSEAKVPKSKRQTCLWSVPIIRGKERIFLVDCTGYSSETEYKRQNEMLCDFLMFLCSQIISIQSRDDKQNKFLSQSYQILKSSQSRMQYNKTYASKDSFFWPANIVFLCRNQELPEQNPFRKLFIRAHYKKLADIKDQRVEDGILDQDLKEILLTKYADRKKKILNESYFQCATACVQQFYDYCCPKFYNQVKPNGKGFATLLMNFILTINCKQKINVSTLIQRTRKQILSQTYNSSARWYTRQLEKELKGQQPKNCSDLLNIFQSNFFKTLKYFQKHCRSSLLLDKDNTQLLTELQEMEVRLQSYMREKQLLIKKINQKKTKKYLKQVIDRKIDIKQMPMQQILELREILYKSKTIERKLDVSRLQCLKQKMIEGWNKFMINEQIKHKDQISKLEGHLQEKKKQLQCLRQKNELHKLKAAQTFQKFSQMSRQSGDISTRVQNIKFQINIHKKTARQKLENSYEKIHLTTSNEQQLLLQLKQYEHKLSKRYKQKTQELKQLREQLEEAYKIESEQSKKITNYNVVSNNNISPTLKQSHQNKISVSQYQLASKELLATYGNNNLPECQQVSFFSKHQPQVPQALMSSRIAKNTESIRILRNQIQQKARTQQQLQQLLSKSYVNFSRVNTQYKNNNVRSTQSRKVQIQRSEKKSIKNKQIDQQNI